jgi:hypothetical protein
LEANLALKSSDCKFKVAFILLAFIVLFHPSSGFCSVIRLAIMPPAIHAGQDMSFLEKGVVDMLIGRVTKAGRSEAVPVAPEIRTLDVSAAVAEGKTVKADYVVMTSITILGSSVSTDAKVLNTETGSISLTFSQAGEDQADIITHINRLADRINTQLLGRQPTASTPTGVQQPKPPADGQGDRGDIHQHPEKLLRDLYGEATGLSPQPKPPAAGQNDQEDIQRNLEKQQRDPDGDTQGLPPRYEAGDLAAESRLITRSRRMERQIRGVTAGDIDGDGANEIICIDSRTVLIYRVAEGRLAKIAELDAGIANFAVDAADLNGNGRTEVFITHFNDEKLRSYVLEWEGAELRRIGDNLRWYFRTIDVAGRGRVLVGQRQGMNELFLPGIFEMGYVDGRFDEVRKLRLPRSRNIFGFTQGAVRAAGEVDIIDYSRDHYLRITDRKGRQEWSSQDSYGGSANALVTNPPGDHDEQDTHYLPSRVHVVDLDNDGIQEIVAAKNEDRAGAFSRLRLFKQGHLEVLKWNQVGLIPVWRTRSVTKFIGDFTVGDVNGDGRVEIVAAIVQNTRNVLGSGSSYLAVFSLDNPKAAVRP